MVEGCGLSVEGLGFRVKSSGCRVYEGERRGGRVPVDQRVDAVRDVQPLLQGSGFRVQGAGLRVQVKDSLWKTR